MTQSTERLSSALADRYRILSRLGEGGMAEQLSALGDRLSAAPSPLASSPTADRRPPRAHG